MATSKFDNYMEKKKTFFSEKIKFYLWVIVVAEVIVFSLAFLFGNNVGYLLSFVGHLWLGVFLAMGLVVLMGGMFLLEVVIRYFDK